MKSTLRFRLAFERTETLFVRRLTRTTRSTREQQFNKAVDGSEEAAREAALEIATSGEERDETEE